MKNCNLPMLNRIKQDANLHFISMPANEWSMRNLTFVIIISIAFSHGCTSDSGQNNVSNTSSHELPDTYPSNGLHELDLAIQNNTLEETKMSGQGFGTSVGVEYALDGITFIQGSARLDPSADAALDQLLSFLKRHDSVYIRLEGYCVQLQNSTANLKVSHQRATAVANFLKEKGISPERLRVVGRGDSQRRRTSGQSSIDASHGELLGIIVEKL